MPGLVVSVNVTGGQEVKAGETLAVIEAMKMENVLTAERDGTISEDQRQEGRQPRAATMSSWNSRELAGAERG